MRLILCLLNPRHCFISNGVIPDDKQESVINNDSKTTKFINVTEVGRNMGFRLKEVISGEKSKSVICRAILLLVGLVTVVTLYSNWSL